MAVLTNASLLFLEDAREDLAKADLASVKVDAVNEATWRRINRPHGSLSLNRILDGIVEFSKSYKGKLITETMLVEGFNTGQDELKAIADFLRQVNPHKAYISIPIRPPAEPYAKPPSPKTLVEAHEIFERKLARGGWSC